jgi:hypothetical protein
MKDREIQYYKSLLLDDDSKMKIFGIKLVESYKPDSKIIAQDPI